MLLLQSYIDNFRKKADTENIKINILGSREELSKSLQKSIEETEEKTKNNTGIVFNIAFNYGGRNEIVNTKRQITIFIKIFA